MIATSRSEIPVAESPHAREQQPLISKPQWGNVGELQGKTTTRPRRLVSPNFLLSPQILQSFLTWSSSMSGWLSAEIYFELFRSALELNCLVAGWPSINIVFSRATKGWTDHSSWDIRCICSQETGDQGQLLRLVDRLSPGKHGGVQEKRVEFYKMLDATFPPDDSQLGPYSWTK